VSRRIGNDAEDRAAQALSDTVYEILARNYNCRFGEIDIIAKQGDYICFVEVKYRNPSGYGTAVDAITNSKMNKILRTAKQYLYETDNQVADYRIDAVIMDGDGVEIMSDIYTQGMS